MLPGSMVIGHQYGSEPDRRFRHALRMQLSSNKCGVKSVAFMQYVAF
jgi:hypothetical protein